MKRVALVNGVPASGKSTLARALAASTGWPVLALDTVKEALFDHLGAGDREHNRMLGRASYQAIFAAIGDFPDGAVPHATRIKFTGAERGGSAADDSARPFRALRQQHDL